MANFFSPSGLSYDPRTFNERRSMTDMLLMATGQLSNPVLLLVLMVADDFTGKWINEGTVWATYERFSAGCQLPSSWRKNVDHRLTGGDEVICDNAAMTSPPYDFGAHDSTLLCVPELA